MLISSHHISNRSIGNVNQVLPKHLPGQPNKYFLFPYRIKSSHPQRTILYKHITAVSHTSSPTHQQLLCALAIPPRACNRPGPDTTRQTPGLMGQQGTIKDTTPQ